MTIEQYLMLCLLQFHLPHQIILLHLLVPLCQLSEQGIGSGANDPQKMDPKASRETLDHSIMYIFAVALEDGKWHHIKSYTSERANRKTTVDLWSKIETHEDDKWTKKYHDPDPKNKCFGGKVIITMKDGKKIEDEIEIADAHPYGRKPFKRSDYVEKFLSLTDGNFIFFYGKFFF